MRTFRTLVAAAAVVAAAALLAPSPDAASQEPAAPPLVAFVDMERIFAESAGAKTISAWAEKEHAKLQADLDERKKKIANLESGLDTMSPGSAKYAARVEQVDRAKWDLRSEQAYMEARLEHAEVQAKAMLWRKTEEAAGRVAAKRGIRIVLKHDPTPIDPGQFQRRDHLSAFALSRRVLWRDDALDITSAVIADLDEAAAKAAAKAAAEKPKDK